MPAKNILLTGGTGFLGNELTQLFAKKNYQVNVLSRNVAAGSSAIRWNIASGFIDPKAFDKTDTIIHLAGARIDQGRWTEKRKREIVDSRVQSANLIFEYLKSGKHQVKTFITASATGIYGNTGDEWIAENHQAAQNFLGQTCMQWEAVANRFTGLGIRVVILRIGIVLSKNDGALPQLAKPVKLFLGSPIGSGNQFMSWIHLNDLSFIFLKAVEDEQMKGVFNAVAPNPVRNKEFMKTLAKSLHRPFLPIGVPSMLIQIFMGEKSEIVLGGQRVSCDLILNSGFKFQFQNLQQALKDIYKN